MVQDTSKALQGIDSSTWHLVRRTVRCYLRPYLKRLMAALFFMALSAAMTAAFAKLIEPVLDQVLVNKRLELVVPMGLAVFAVFFFNGLATYLHTILMNIIGQSVLSDIQRDLFSKLVNLDLKFFHEHPSGQLTAHMVSDVAAMRAAVSDSLTGIGKSFLTLLFLIVLMFMQDAVLALIAFVIFPPAAIFVSYLGKRLRKVSGGIQTQIASLMNLLSQVFLGIRQVKAYGMEQHERARIDDAIRRVNKLIFKGVRMGNLSTPMNETLLGLAFMGVVMYGGFQVINENLTVGELMSFVAAFALAYEPLKRLAKLNNNLQMGLGAAERIYALIDRRPTIADKPDARVLAVSRPEIVFEDVSFHYGPANDKADDKYALNGLTFTAPAGKVTALVGPSGSGKTTALNLVPRFYDVTGGRVLIDANDVRDVTVESLRRHIALVSQDITIFDDTVRANIAYSKADATDADIEAAARAAAADEFIRAMPEGYATRLGENGVKLSGGQRQRIAIARAMLRDAPILLLDEATSALDNESERAIQASLERLQQGRTTIVIAHRLSTVQQADVIVVFDKGRVVESGSHEALIAQDGLYARMHRSGLGDNLADNSLPEAV